MNNTCEATVLADSEFGVLNDRELLGAVAGSLKYDMDAFRAEVQPGA